MKNIHAYTKAFIVAFFLFLAHLGHATNYNFRHLKIEDGLSSNSVFSIVQDEKGYIWFGTQYGLDRYDGTRIEQMLPNVYTEHLMIDSHNTLWAVTWSGIVCYDSKSGSFYSPETADTLQTFPTTRITAIVEDKEGKIWISTYIEGVYCYTPSTKQITQYTIDYGINGARGLICDRENNIWVTAKYGNTPLMKLNKAEHKFQPVLLHGEAVIKEDILGQTLFEDATHHFWIGTWNKGIIKINPLTSEATRYELPGGKNGAQHIHCINEIKPGILHIGSDDGLVEFDIRKAEAKLIPHNNSARSLSNKFVYPIVKDREGGLWVGTYYGGVNYASPNDAQFARYTHHEGENSVAGNTIARFCEDKEGYVWIASDDGGLSRFNPRNNTFYNYPSGAGENSLSYHNAHALCAENGNIWIGTYGGGLNQLDTKSGKFKHFTSGGENQINDNSVYSLLYQNKESLWIGTMRGIDRYNIAENRFEFLKQTDALVIDIDSGSQGEVWFATSGKGVLRYSTQNNSWEHYDTSTPEKGLLTDDINSLHFDKKGQLWAATAKGLARFSPKDNRFETLPLSILNQNIMAVIEDDERLWLTTARGLVQYQPSTGKCLVFSRNNGLVCDQFISNSGLMASDGRIYVGTVEGFSSFFPHQIAPNRYIPPVVLTSIEVNNRAAEITKDGLLTKPLSETKEIELPASCYMVSFNFAALSFCTPENNRYAYKLEGFDRNWIEIDTQHKATYTNLPAGSYTFKVMASNNDGVWNEEGVTLRVVVKQPWYWTIGLKIVYFALLILTVGLLMRYYKRRTEKRHAEHLKALSKEKEKELYTAKIDFFTTIAHEIRTPVSLIMGPLEQIMQRDEYISPKINASLEVIQRNSHRLLDLINQLLDFRKVEQGGLKIKFVRTHISPVVSAVAVRFKPWVEQRGHELTVEYPENDFEVCIDTEAVTKVISNLLTNANKYTQKQIKLRLYKDESDKHFCIEVIDDGMGIAPDEKEKIFNAFYQAEANKPGTGIGLSIVQNIVHRHHGSVEVESNLGEGSRFIVTLPIEQQHGEVLDAVEEVSKVISPTLQAEEEMGNAEENIAPQKSTLLLVDDNEEMLAFLSSNFANDFLILTAENGKEALEVLARNKVNFIVSDWMMPEMDGVEFCREVRKNALTSHLPFVLLTAKTDTDSKITGMDCGADAYVEKPFSVAYLRSCIHNILSLRKMLREKFSSMPEVAISTVANNSTDQLFLERLNGIIEENFSNSDLSVDFLAEQMCISRSGLFVKVKALTDCTPNELIQVVRLKKAAQILKQQNLRMNEVCYKVGFNNPSYFAKCFQKQFGMRPSEYAKGETTAPK